jgi:hypothetical protein|tara:strand:- start:1183 stop:1707 length:525 start_codon:yes stop_codon:yes gene_type:complete
MAILGIDDFKSKLTGGGARSNLFKVTVNYPSFVEGDVELTSFLCKASVMPDSTINEIAVPFRGRQLKMAGDRVFGDWNVTIINDTDFKIRDAMEKWSNGINEHVNNTGLTNTNDYFADMVVEQLDKDGSSLKKYDFRGCWPKTIAEIALDYGTEGIEEFQVTFAMQYWESNTTS